MRSLSVSSIRSLWQNNEKDQLFIQLVLFCVGLSYMAITTGGPSHLRGPLPDSGANAACGYCHIAFKNKRPTAKVGLLFFYHLSSDDTVSFLRPRRRRAANTRRPLGVDMRSRKPCLLRRLRSDGWNVLFISRYFYIFPSTIWECKGSIFEFICKIFYKDFSTSLEMTVKLARNDSLICYFSM